ncbi:hypothetical protein BH24DEI1_BH24DEI1_01680 [soil metagenome]
MSNERITGILFIALGALALFVLVFLSGLAGAWLWAGTLAAALLYLYARGRGYAFLVAGCLLTGLAVGLVLGGSVGAILVSLGAGFFAIDRLEPRASSWPLYPAGALAALGLLVCLIRAGPFGWLLLAVLLIALGALLLRRGKDGSGWVYTQPASPAPPPSTPAPTSSAPASSAPPTPAERSPESEVVKNALQGREDVQAAEAGAETPLTGADAELYSRLESWRKARARGEKGPAYIVLTNDSLRRIAREKPQTLGDLSRVKGIGPVKLERYGAEILALVQDEPKRRTEN